jgi:ubiquinone/menaquinone biosynthesis C-methylase UbiE
VSGPIQSVGGIQAFYDDPTVVESYLDRRTAQPLNSVLHERQVSFLNDVITELKPWRMLEVAPGPGRLSAEVLPVPVPVGIDASPRMLVEARRQTRAHHRPHWSFIHGDGFRLPFADGVFDLAYSVRFVRRFERERRSVIYREIRRVVRPGGHVVFDAQNRLVAEPHRSARGLDRYPVYDELYLRDELVAELEAAGLAPVRIEGIMRRFTWQWRLNRLRRFRLGPAARVLIRALEHAPDANPSTWMVLCKVSGA